MKILHVESGMHLYGGAAQVLDLLRGSRGSGVGCVLACPQGSAIAAAAPDTGAEVIAMPMRGDLDVALIFRLRRALNQHAPDILHLHGRRGADWLGGLAAWRSGIPAVVSRRVDHPLPRAAVRPYAALFTRVVAISEGIRGILLRGGLDPTRVVCVPDGVDCAAWAVAPDRGRLEGILGLTPGLPVVGVIAQLIERKGHDVLLDAWPGVLAGHPQAQLVFFGQGPREAHLRGRVSSVAWSASVHFAGFRDDLPELVGALDLVVHPALREGMGVAVLQAAATARPIVASRTGGIPEAVLDEKTGLLVPPGDVRALGAAIRRLLAAPDLAAALGARAAAHVAARFSAEAMVAGNLAVYTQLLSCPGRRGKHAE